MRDLTLKQYKRTIIINDGYISISPLLSEFGFKKYSIEQKIRTDHLLLKHSRIVQEGRMHFFHFSRRGFLRLITLIKPSTLTPLKAHEFIDYQDYIVEYLYKERSN